MNRSAKQLLLKNLHVRIHGNEIIKGLDLKINAGEMHVVMGPNGSGKSTLCNALMGHPDYEVKGQIVLNGENIGRLSPDKRARMGLFLGFQYPKEVPGVTFGNFLRIATNTVKSESNKKFRPYGPAEFYPLVLKELENLKMDKLFIGRGLNDGFSGGEKKRAELAQMAVLKPGFAILDEIDSGLDIDGLKIVANAIRKIYMRNKMGLILITHYQRILNYLKPDHVHVMVHGKIVKSGGHKLAAELEESGYGGYISK